MGLTDQYHFRPYRRARARRVYRARKMELPFTYGPRHELLGLEGDWLVQAGSHEFSMTDVEFEQTFVPVKPGVGDPSGSDHRNPRFTGAVAR